MNNEINKDQMVEEEDFQLLQLSDCDVPVGCPGGVNPGADAFPDHWT